LLIHHTVSGPAAQAPVFKCMDWLRRRALVQASTKGLNRLPA
jgi:hypothetical protein